MTNGASSAAPSDSPSSRPSDTPITLSQVNGLMNSAMGQMLEELARQQREGIQQQVQAAVQAAVHQFQQHQQQPQVPSSSSASSSSSSAANLVNSSSLSSLGSLPSMVKVAAPGNFTGAQNINVDTWLFEMNQYLTVCGVLTDEQRIAVASSYLKEAALQWWLGRCRLPNIPPRDWLSFVAALKERFQPLAASRTARAQLRGLRQAGMTVAEYSYKFNNLIQLITDMSEADQVELFVYGLRNAIAREVDMSDPKTLQDAMTRAQRVELILDNRRTYNPRSHFSSNYSNPSGQSSSGYSHSSSSSGSSAGAPMELGNVNTDTSRDLEFKDEGAEMEAEYQRYLQEGEEYEPSYQREDSEAQGAEESAEDSEMLQAMQQRAGGRAQSISREEFARCMRERLCLRCKKPGHMARNCPQRPHYQQKAKRNFQ